MTPFINIALIGWFPLAVVLFAWLPARRALIAGVVGGIMFLPMGDINLPLVAGRKDVLCSLGLLVGALLIDPDPLLQLRPRWVDLPMALLALNPLVSAAANGLPPATAISACTGGFVQYGLPYLLGRAYLTDLRAARELAMGIFLGGLLYVPGCIFEMIFSPTLHERVYGKPAFPDFMQSVRLGGYRPVMFMQHGLMVALFMCGAAVMGLWLWCAGGMRRVWGIPAALPVIALVLVAIGCKSAGALILMAAALAALLAARWLRTGALVYALVLVAPLYILARTVGGWSGADAVTLAAETLTPAHAGSLQVRFDNENVLIDRAMKKPLFGWGPNGDFLVKDTAGRVTSIPDGLWVIALGGGGLVGLAAFFGAFLLPTAALLYRFPARTWSDPQMAAPAALAVFAPTYAIDCLMNAMLNPIWIVAMGALAALATARDPYGVVAAQPRLNFIPQALPYRRQPAQE